MQIFKGFFFFFKFPSLLRGLGHRQISPSPSYLRDMTFLACGASLVFTMLVNADGLPAPQAPR